MTDQLESSGVTEANPVNRPRIERALARANKRNELPRLFAVVTWGCTATNWFAKALNSHPDVFCVHTMRPRLGMISPTMDQVDDADLMSMLRLLGMGYTLAGDVHGTNRASIPRLQSIYGDEFRAAGMVREPMKRLRSQYALFDADGFDTTRVGDLSYLKTVAGYDEIQSLVDDAAKTCFVHSVNMLNTIVEETQLIPQILRHEDITTDAAAFKDAVDYLSSGTVRADDDFVARVMQSNTINRHTRTEQQPTWSDWQTKIIQAIVRPEAWRLYRDFGYETPDFISVG